jgi:signal transduction histidine kinase
MSREFRPSADYDPLQSLAHLSSLVGHHLINSYSSIVNNAEVLRLLANNGNRVDPEEFHDRIIRNAIEASQVARKLIDLVRPATCPEDEPIDLARLIKEAVDEVGLIPSSRISWEVATEPIPMIPGSEEELRGMFRSILINAVEAIGDREGRVAARMGLDDQSWIVVEIEDNGIGMEEVVATEATTPFFSTKSGHLGVGLSIAGSVWRRHKGSLAIVSRPGSGTTIRLTFDTSRCI